MNYKCEELHILNLAYEGDGLACLHSNSVLSASLLYRWVHKLL